MAAPVKTLSRSTRHPICSRADRFLAAEPRGWSIFSPGAAVSEQPPGTPRGAGRGGSRTGLCRRPAAPLLGRRTLASWRSAERNASDCHAFCTANADRVLRDCTGGRQKRRVVGRDRAAPDIGGHTFTGAHFTSPCTGGIILPSRGENERWKCPASRPQSSPQRCKLR